MLAGGLSVCGGSGDNSGVGKYIYRDDAGIYHVDSNCRRLTNGKDEHGHEIYGKSLIDTATFVIDGRYEFTVCSQCVGDVEYERLVAISNRNQGLQTKAGTSKMATLKEVYDAFKADGAPLPDTYEAFETYMTSGPNGGYDHRKQWYDAFKADEAPLPDTYEQFSEALFAAKPHVAKLAAMHQAQDILDALYDNLKEDGWVKNSREHFRTYFLAPGEEGYRNRKALYDNLKEDGYVDSPTYEEFARRMGLGMPLRMLYDALKSDNYDVPDTYESFERTLTAPGAEGTNNRVTLYNTLKSDNYDVPDTYESFANALFAAVDSFERLYDKLWRENYIETGKDEFMSFVYAPDGRGYKNRRSLYARLRNDGRIADSTYEAFASRIGLHARSQLPEKLRVEELQ